MDRRPLSRSTAEDESALRNQRLHSAEERLRSLLSEVERRELKVASLTREIEEQFSALLTLAKKLESVEEVPREPRKEAREAWSAFFEVSDEVDEIQEEAAENRELIYLALIELLEKQGACP